MKNFIYVILLSLTAFLVTASSEPNGDASCEPLYQKNNTIHTPDLGKDSSSIYCCKICKKGKACGDSCINKNYTCTKPPGCACNG
tara:strand:+ start:5674 stop:5928 length:255 start_codon:yes stop_codon:yes gene_type:complete